MKKRSAYPKRPRLKGFPYQGQYAYFVTVGTSNKRPFFSDSETVKVVSGVIRVVAAQCGFLVYVYCFMPDHLHLLFSGSTEASLARFVKIFKQKSGFYFRQMYQQKLWQPSYWDHVLRAEESLEQVARYIFENPVRKGLVNSFKEYPFSGSMIFDLSNF